MAASHDTPSARDIERLSAYLDGELSERERDALEHRLARESELRETLDDMRATVAMLHSLPRLKAPRDFTLDPAHYARPAPWWQRLFTLEITFQVSGALGAAASVAIIVLALVLGGESTGQDTSETMMTTGRGTDVALQSTPQPDPLETATAAAVRTAIAYAGQDLIQTTIVAQSTYFASPPNEMDLQTIQSSPAPNMFEAEAVPDMTMEDMAEAEEAADMADQPFAAGAAQSQPSGDTGAGSMPPSEPTLKTGGTTTPPSDESPEINMQQLAPSPAMDEALEDSAADSAADDMSDPMDGEGAAARTFDNDSAAAELDMNDDAVLGATGPAAAMPVPSPTLAFVAEIPTGQPAPEQPLARAPAPPPADDSSETPWWLVALGAAGLIVSAGMFIVGRRKAARA